ncbi:MAG: hypothetical protein H7338_19280 [Candidatus Sericytochromatia bacterium]|nr:hypothetical protein [Candidatus Sericytochromatia bacterium]
MFLKRLTLCFVALCAFLALHTPAWAAAVQVQPAPIAAEQLDFSPAQIAAIQEMVAAGSNKPLIRVESWTWLFSVVPGLGQVLMGEVLRGVLFFLGAAILPGVIAAVLGAILLTVSPGLWFLTPIIGLVGLAIWIWNLFDAYQLNQALLGKTSEIQLTPNMRARREEGAVALRLDAIRF